MRVQIVKKFSEIDEAWQRWAIALLGQPHLQLLLQIHVTEGQAAAHRIIRGQRQQAIPQQLDITTAKAQVEALGSAQATLEQAAKSPLFSTEEMKQAVKVVCEEAGEEKADPILRMFFLALGLDSLRLDR